MSFMATGKVALKGTHIQIFSDMPLHNRALKCPECPMTFDLARKLRTHKAKAHPTPKLYETVRIFLTFL